MGFHVVLLGSMLRTFKGDGLPLWPKLGWGWGLLANIRLVQHDLQALRGA
jgi:hypothetical protein